MAKLHHATLKAAVLKYGALIGTMPEEAIKSEIAKDKKGFDADGIDEIYTAITTPADKGEENIPDGNDEEKSAKSKKKAKHIVISPFRDKDNFNVLHSPGTDVSHFEPKRLEDLLTKKLVEKQ